MIRALRLSLVLSALAASAAWAQTSPLGQSPGPAPGQPEETKPEGAAEKAPKETTKLPTLPPLPPYPGQDKKKFELVELNGYLRFRTSWFDHFNLGYHAGDANRQTPFREPLACLFTPTTTPNAAADSCSGSIGSANMRVRLEPTIHISETVSIHMLVDVLDNLVLGSTPQGTSFDGTTKDPSVPGQIFSGSQDPPEGGKNSPWDSIRVKEAYGKVKTPLGELTFGRQPSQWGLGILANSGGYDWIHGTYCTDCDWGDHVDRVMFGTTIPGTQFRAAAAFDWASGAPTAGQLDVWKNRSAGQPYDLEDNDDVAQWTFMITRIDDPETWRQTVKEGKTAFNFGAYFQYRSQDFEAQNVVLGQSTNLAGNYVSRHASMYIPDVWARFTTGNVTLETELVGVFGDTDNLTPNPNDPLGGPKQKFRMLGGVAKLDWMMLDDDLHLGLELGFASGDQWESENGAINVHEANYFPQAAYDTTITNFRFNYDYRVDLIFFREILGAITNATYAKPSVSYNITDRIGFKLAGILSFANVPVATPGNDISGRFYGVELDGELGYNNKDDGFFAGLYYGVFFPFGALDYPALIYPDLNPPAVDQHTPSTAQTVQAKLVLKF